MLLVFLGVLGAAWGGTDLAAKLQRIETASRTANPQPPITLTAFDVNAFFRGPGARKLPAGVSHLVLSSQPPGAGGRAGSIEGTAQVDFDRLPHGRTSARMLLLGALFSGVHELAVHAAVRDADAPTAHLHVDWVNLDGQTLPNFLIDAALQQFVQPKHPEISRDFAVALPRHATRAAVGTNVVELEYGR
ncbi:MAG: hypothetical protein ACYC6M_08260 [Terriglobales bacterium]